MKPAKRPLELRAETVRLLSGDELIRIRGGATVPDTHAAGCATWGNGTDCDPPPIVGGGQ
jgi:hypothetical protein